MTDFRDSFGLITSEPNSELEENSLLFTIEHYFLLKELGLNPKKERNIINSALFTCDRGGGIFRQHPAELTGHDRYMSHDQLTAIVAYSKSENLKYHKQIWKEIKRQLLRYNNIEIPNNLKEKVLNGRLLHPRDILFAGCCNGNIICNVLIFILIVIMFISCWSKRKVIAYGAPTLKTDGKLLTFIRVRAIGYKWLINFFDWVIEKRFGSWSVVFKVYFRYSQHPNVVHSILI